MFSIKVHNMLAEHIPVLAGPVRELMVPKSDGVVIDGTLGLGGHSEIFARALGPGGMLIGMDVDKGCIASAKKRLKGLGLACKMKFYQANFAEIADVLAAVEVEAADVILADLGFCSAQMADAQRGLSFQLDGKLDMRLDDRLKRTAADIVNSMDEKGLADILFEFGQERASRKIARSIVHYRRNRKIKTTRELSDVICGSMRVNPLSRKSKIHPATKVFQALRIVVNDELGVLKSLLAEGPKLLNSGGKIGIISFHSLEDRIVKYDFREKATSGGYKILTKKPIVADEEEKRINPRSRSAKFRILEKC